MFKMTDVQFQKMASVFGRFCQFRSEKFAFSFCFPQSYFYNFQGSDKKIASGLPVRSPLTVSLCKSGLVDLAIEVDFDHFFLLQGFHVLILKLTSDWTDLLICFCFREF